MNLAGTKKNAEVSTMETTLTGPFGRTVLGTTNLTVGRAADNALVLNDPRVSSHHAEIRPEGQYYSVIDLGSTNGTFVNEQQLMSMVARPLQSGDTIRFGDTKTSFETISSSQSYPAYSEGSTMRATPPPAPPAGGAPGFAGNTSYGYGDINHGAGQPNYQGPPSAPNPYTPYQSPSQPSQYDSQAQVPTYIPASYGQADQQSSFTPQPPPPQPPTFIPTQPPQQLPGYSPTPPPQRKRSPLLTIILVVIALVVILGALGGFFVIHNNQVAQDNAHATATAHAHATGIAHANATSTAQTIATATQVAGLTATAEVTSHYPPFTNLAFNDSLTSTNDSQWPSSSVCGFISSGFRVSIAEVGKFQWCNPQSPATYSDFALQVTMNIQIGDCDGLIFREVDNNNFYTAFVCADGTYDLGLFNKGTPTWTYSLSQRHASSAINKGTGQQNVIALVVSGDTFNLYVNDLTKVIDTFTDNTFTQGVIGLVANDFVNPTSVVYTNALVWTQ